MGIINFLLEILVAIFSGTFEVLLSLLQALFEKKEDHSYKAEFGNPNDQFSKKHGNGFRIGYEYGNTLLESNSHLICFGGSGSQKSTCIGYNTLLQSHDCSYVIFDTSREYHTHLSNYLHKVGYSIDVIDFDDFEYSASFNFLENCTKENEVYQNIHVLFDNTFKDSQRDYWVMSAEKITGLFAYAIWKHADTTHKNMSNVYNMMQIFSYAPDKIDAWIVSKSDDKITKAYKSVVSAPEKTLMSTVATALQVLSIYDLPNIAAISSKSSLTFESFRNTKRALFLCGSPSSMQQGNIISSTFFASFFDFILRRAPAPGTYDIMFMVDEAANMRLNLSQILELGRKFRISIATLWQDYNQIEHLYSSKNIAENILANSRLKVFMPSGQPYQTCVMLSNLLGKYSYETENGVKNRELLTPQEVFQLDKILVLNGNKKPCLLPKKPFFENKKLLAYSKLPPYKPTGSKLAADVLLINF